MVEYTYCIVGDVVGQETSIKLAAAPGGGPGPGPCPAAAAGVVKVTGDGVTAAAKQRRPKTTKQRAKKPSLDAAGTTAAAGALHAGTTAGALASAAGPGRGATPDVKLETGSMGAGDDSGINVNSETSSWQRNGHSADFIRHSLGQFHFFPTSPACHTTHSVVHPVQQ